MPACLLPYLRPRVEVVSVQVGQVLKLVRKEPACAPIFLLRLNMHVARFWTISIHVYSTISQLEKARLPACIGPTNKPHLHIGCVSEPQRVPC